MKNLTIRIMAMYIGCEVLINDETHENTRDTLTYLNDVGDCGGHEIEWQSKNCALILRPLSSMSEEEARELNWKYRHPDGSIPNRPITFLPDEFTYLLSKSFDLFNLIPEGLAIDKTTLKN